ncbi:MAG: LacI family DNA-binding transcriptional regulator [Spirochaetales bacterium]
MEKIKRVTVYDVAKELGISASTVSRVLNNSILIGEETRALILETARRMGYEKRPIRKHRNRAILNIKLFLPAHRYVSTHLFYNPAELIQGLYEGFQDVRVNIITRLAGQGGELFQTKKLGDIDGCIFAFTEPDDVVYQRLSERGIPCLELNRIHPDRDYVSCDNEGGIRRLLQELYKVQGKRLRPYYLGFSQIPFVEEQRLKGYLEGVKELQIQESSFRVIDTLSEITPAFLKQLKKEGYTALLCFNDVVAVYCYQCALSCGLRIPEDLSLTGFDNSPVRELVSKRIDTISLSVPQLAREAGAWLRRRIIDRDLERIQKLIEGDYVPGETLASGTASSERPGTLQRKKALNHELHKGG